MLIHDNGNDEVCHVGGRAYVSGTYRGDVLDVHDRAWLGFAPATFLAPREQRGSRIATNQLMGQNSRIEAIPSGYGERRTYDLHRR